MVKKELKVYPDGLREQYTDSAASENRLGHLGQLLAKEGIVYSHSIDQVGALHHQIEWEQKAEDYRMFDDVVNLLASTSHYSDEAFAREVIPYLAEVPVLFPDSLMARLHNPLIPVSKAHQGTTPFQHTINVMRSLRTDSFRSDNDRFWIRTGAFFHDVGKLCIARQDRNQYHAHISAIVYQDYLTSRLGLEIARERARVIQYHHVYELVDWNILSVDEVSKLLVNIETIQHVSVLADADTRSVEQYARFAVYGADTLLKILSAIDNLLDQIIEFATVFVSGIHVVLTQLQQSITGVDTQRKRRARKRDGTSEDPVQILNEMIERINRGLQNLSIKGEMRREIAQLSPLRT